MVVSRSAASLPEYTGVLSCLISPCLSLFLSFWLFNEAQQDCADCDLSFGQTAKMVSMTSTAGF